MDMASLDRLLKSTEQFNVIGVHGSMLKISNGTVTKIVLRSELQRLLDNKEIDLFIPTYRCLKKLRDKRGIIRGYLIESTGREKRQVSAEWLKEAIRNYRAVVVNLKLTKDNRLIDNTEQKSLQDFLENNIKYIEMDRNLVKKLMEVIMKVLKRLNKTKLELDIHGEYDKNIKGNWKVLGNSNLGVLVKTTDDRLMVMVQPSEGCIISLPRDSDLLFVNKHTLNYESDETGIRILKLRLYKLDWSSVSSARKMFYCTKIENLVIENLHSNELIDMALFAQLSELTKVDLGLFKVSSLENARNMFSCCVNLSCQNVNIKGISPKHVDDAHLMFGIPYRSNERFIATSKFIDCASGLNGILSGTSDVKFKLFPNDSIDNRNLYSFESMCERLGWGEPDDMQIIKVYDEYDDSYGTEVEDGEDILSDIINIDSDTCIRVQDHESAKLVSSTSDTLLDFKAVDEPNSHANTDEHLDSDHKDSIYKYCSIYPQDLMVVYGLLINKK